MLQNLWKKICILSHEKVGQDRKKGGTVGFFMSKIGTVLRIGQNSHFTQYKMFGRKVLQEKKFSSVVQQKFVPVNGLLRPPRS